MRIMIAAGGTGGHVYPALAVAEAITTHRPETRLFFVGSVDGFERPLVEKGGVPFEGYDEVQAGPLHGVSVLRMLQSSVKLVLGIFQSFVLLRRRRPDVILLTGGWVGLPVALAAWIMRVPSLIFLPDIEPGLSIRVLQRFARRVALAIPESDQYFPDGKTVVTGYPVRQALESATKPEGLEHFGLDPVRQTLLVFGGSRGAQTINTAITNALPSLLEAGLQVIHVTGTLDWDRVCQETGPLKADHYHPYPYLHSDMGLALAAADLVVSRAGAGVLGEFPLFGLPSILVPYPYAWRYQKVNADYLASRNAAIYMADEQMADELQPMILDLFAQPQELEALRQNVSALAQPGSARRVAAELEKLAGEGAS